MRTINYCVKSDSDFVKVHSILFKTVLFSARSTDVGIQQVVLPPRTHGVAASDSHGSNGQNIINFHFKKENWRKNFRICCGIKKIVEKGKIMENLFVMFQTKVVFKFSAIFVMIRK